MMNPFFSHPLFLLFLALRRRLRLLSAFIVILSIAFSPLGYADELYQTWTSARALGMGNAYTAVVRNSDSLFYNPAGLGRVNGIKITAIDVKGAANNSSAYPKLKNLQGGSSTDFADTVNDLYGDRVTANASAKTAVVIPYFGFGIFDNFDFSFTAENPAMTTLNTNAINDISYAVGAAAPFGPFIDAGFVAKKIKRIGVRQLIGPSVLGNLSSDALKNSVNIGGNGYSLDLGMNLIIPGPAQPVISFTWRNFGVTKFMPDTVGGLAPPSERDDMTLGASLTFSSMLVNITPAIDLRYMNRQDVQTTKKISFGCEIALPLIELRAGFNQGYYTAGVGVNLGLIRVDAATYGVELGAYAGQLVDRRYVLEAALELDFDFGNSSGKGSGSRGSSRHLKQRR